MAARCLARRDAQNLGGHAHWPAHFDLFLLGTIDHVGAHLLEVLYVRARQRDTNAVQQNFFSCFWWVSLLIIIIS